MPIQYCWPRMAHVVSFFYLLRRMLLANVKLFFMCIKKSLSLRILDSPIFLCSVWMLGKRGGVEYREGE